jgi:hypothetical protein
MDGALRNIEIANDGHIIGCNNPDDIYTWTSVKSGYSYYPGGKSF